MITSRRIARIAGPTLIVLGLSEAINIDSFAGIAAPVVYLNGALLFIADLSIVQAHNRWVRNWPLILTLVGWILMFGGLYRMFAPTAPQLGKGVALYGVLATLVAVGLALVYHAYVAADARRNPL